MLAPPVRRAVANDENKWMDSSRAGRIDQLQPGMGLLSRCLAAGHGLIAACWIQQMIYLSHRSGGPLAQILFGLWRVLGKSHREHNLQSHAMMMERGRHDTAHVALLLVLQATAVSAEAAAAGIVTGMP